jgi:hypothetical protein
MLMLTQSKIKDIIYHFLSDPDKQKKEGSSQTSQMKAGMIVEYLLTGSGSHYREHIEPGTKGHGFYTLPKSEIQAIQAAGFASRDSLIRLILDDPNVIVSPSYPCEYEGLTMEAHPDIVLPGNEHVIYDLKYTYDHTQYDPERLEFSKKIQALHYCWCYRLCTGVDPLFFWLLVSSKQDELGKVRLKSKSLTGLDWQIYFAILKFVRSLNNKI